MAVLQCGPAQLGREIALGKPKHKRAPLLQCGPAQLGREMRLPRQAYERDLRLQCGPAQLGREIVWQQVRADPLAGFNAARPNWAGK